MHYPTMIRASLLAGLLGISTLVQAAEIRQVTEPIKLFNGKDLSNFYVYLKEFGANNDPDKVFSVKDGMIHITGQHLGCITTHDSFDRYKIVLEFKWGEKAWPPRENKTLDSGLLVHSVGEDGGYNGIWKHSIEVQMIEGGTGDFIVVGDGTDAYSLTTTVAKEKQGSSYVFSEKGQEATINGGRINWWGRSPDWSDTLGFRGEHDVENPVGEWNTLEVTVDGGEITTYLNGIKVNASTATTPDSGQIQIQSEYAELFVRRVDLLPIEDFGKRARNAANPEAIAALESGAKDFANAAWWGFDEEDATDILQAAIDSGAKKVVVPFVGKTWITRPLTLRSDLELFFEPGVLLLAKRGEFLGGGDSLLSAHGAENLKIIGYGATLRMWKEDYQKPPYVPAEWRMGIRLMGCKNVLVEGVRVESSGGDGIYIDGGGPRRWAEDTVIRNVVCDDHHRQGMSVISAQNLLIENSVFSNTHGTAPTAGIDFEPDSRDQRMVNCVVRNSVFENNSGHQVLVYLKPLDHNSEEVSIRFENCVARMGKPGMTLDDFTDMDQEGWAGFSVGACNDNGPRGTIEFINCTTENTGKEAVKIFDVSANSVDINFRDCTFANPWVSTFRDYGGPRVPILLHARRPGLSGRFGGVLFQDCEVYDWANRPAVQFLEDSSDNGLFDVSGQVTVYSPHGAKKLMGDKLHNVTLKVVNAE